MQRIFDPTAAATLPAVPALSGSVGYFTGGVPGSVAATRVRAWYLNMLQEELMTLLTTAGITPDTTGSNFTQVLQAIQTLGKIKATATLNLYVGGSGASDTLNNGLSSGAPFATLQHAANVVLYAYDLNGFTANINVANGTYTAGVTVDCSKLRGSIHFIGNTGSPSSCAVTLPGGGSCFNVINSGPQVFVSGFQVSAPSGSTGAPWTSPGFGLSSSNGAQLIFDHVAFGASSYAHMAANAGGYIGVPAASTPYSISGGAVGHAIAGGTAGYISIPSAIVTVTGTPAFSTAFAEVDAGALVFAPSASFSGAATGPRYLCSNGGAIETNGAGASFFPGSTAGSSTTGYYS
jgi:hypothetical protein